MTNKTTPMLVTFDGEARSGKGTIVQKTKDYLRDECGYKVMLIDRGQTFRVLVVAAERDGVVLDDPLAIDSYLADEATIARCVQFVKDVYYMPKEERDALLYTDQVGANSAKVGARPASQTFVKMLTKKWVSDAAKDGFSVVLVDGRALEGIGKEMHAEGLCDYRLGLFFVCDKTVGARRTLGYAATPYTVLSEKERQAVDRLVEQITERNRLDYEREVERLIRPSGTEIYTLPAMPRLSINNGTTPLFTIDTSADLTKEEMSLPVAWFVAEALST